MAAPATKDISLVFFGSGPVAARSLELLAQDFTIEAVITKPRPQHHKGDVPVLRLAKQLGLQTFSPTNKRELSDLFTTKPVSSTLGVVIDYGIIIAQDVIDYFPLGIINSHFSLLPEWRGADPITFSILSGQKQTGVSLMLITAGLDEGPLLSQTPYDLPAGITTPALTEELIQISHWSLVRVLPLYLSGKTLPAPQEEVTIAETKTPTFSRKLTKEDSFLDYSKPAEQLEREIRAFVEWPKSRTKISDMEIVVTAASVMEGTGEAGTVWRDGKRLGFYTAHGILEILKLKPSGKQDMTTEAFLAGYGRLLG